MHLLRQEPAAFTSCTAWRAMGHLILCNGMPCVAVHTAYPLDLLVQLSPSAVLHAHVCGTRRGQAVRISNLANASVYSTGAQRTDVDPTGNPTASPRQHAIHSMPHAVCYSLRAWLSGQAVYQYAFTMYRILKTARYMCERGLSTSIWGESRPPSEGGQHTLSPLAHTDPYVTCKASAACDALCCDLVTLQARHNLHIWRGLTQVVRVLKREVQLGYPRVVQLVKNVALVFDVFHHFIAHYQVLVHHLYRILLARLLVARQEHRRKAPVADAAQDIEVLYREIDAWRPVSFLLLPVRQLARFRHAVELRREAYARRFPYHDRAYSPQVTMYMVWKEVKLVSRSAVTGNRSRRVWGTGHLGTWLPTPTQKLLADWVNL